MNHTKAADSLSQVRKRLWSLLVPVSLFVSALAAYSTTLTRWHFYDVLDYALRVKLYHQTHQLANLCHPQHLLFTVAGLAAWRILSSLGMHLDALRALQCMNAAFAAAGLVLTYEVLRRGGFHMSRDPQKTWTATPQLALASAVTMGASFAYWVCATDARVNTPALVFLIVAVGLLWGMLDAPSPWQAAASAMAGVVAAGFHQGHGLLLFGGAAAILTLRKPWTKKVCSALVYAGVFALGTATLYLTFGFWVRGLHTLGELRHWSLWAAYHRNWWSFTLLRNTLIDLKTIARLYVTPLPVPTEGAAWPGAGILVMVLSAGAILGTLWVIWCALRVCLRSPKSTATPSSEGARQRMIMLACVGVPFALFFTVWDPAGGASIDHWLPVDFFLTACLAIAAQQAAPVFRRQMALGLGLWAAALLAANLTITILPRTSWAHNPELRLCDALRKHVLRGDLLIMTGEGFDPETRLYRSSQTPIADTEVYVPYFTGITEILIRTCLRDSHGNIGQMIAPVRRSIQETLRRGHRVIVFDEFQNPRAWRRLATTYPVTPATAGRILQGYSERFLVRCADVEAFQVTPASLGSNEIMRISARGNCRPKSVESNARATE